MLPAPMDADYDWSKEPISYIYAGARIRLQHIITQKQLHSHDLRPPVSDVEFQNEVSGYGHAGFEGDANDDWIVEIESAARGDRESGKRVKTLRTKFRLRHAMTGCYLFSHKVKLPEWGFEQQEVTCNKNAVRANSLWVVETSMHPACMCIYVLIVLNRADVNDRIVPEDAPKVNYRPMSFLAKFLELQQVMWTTNAGLTDRHTYDSRPQSWWWMRRGIVSLSLITCP